MASRAEEIPDPVLAVIEDEPSAMTFDKWLALITSDEPSDIEAEAAEVLWEIREHGER